MVEQLTNLFYINLNSRPDRRKNVEKEIEKLQLPNTIKIHRFAGIQLPKKPGSGAIGCSMSHLKCIKIAKEKGWPNVVIIEDDIEFLNPLAFRTQLNAFLTLHKNDFDVCLLAGNVIPPFTKIDDCCIRIKNCQTTTGYIVNDYYYDILIKNYSESIEKLIKEPDNHRFYAIDKWWFQLQERDRWMLIIPLTVSQREDYSDIEDRTTNYHRVMLDLEKKWMFTQKSSDFHNINVNTIKNEIKNMTIGLPLSLPNIQTKKKIIKKNMNSIITG